MAEVSGAAKSDIFISYACEDVTRVGLLVAALQAEGWTVFWDREILPGDDWESHLGVHLGSAPVVIAVWSSHSVESRYVKSEVNCAFRDPIYKILCVDVIEAQGWLYSVNQYGHDCLALEGALPC